MNAEIWQEFITQNTIVKLHGEGIARYGGLDSPPREGCIEQSTGGAYNAGLYTASNDPPTTLEIALPFAGYLLYYLAKNHCFVDGNKRVAWESCVRVLAHFGLTVEVTQEAAEELVDAVVNDRIDNGADVVNWIAERLGIIEIEEPIQ